MSACPSQTFANFTPQQFSVLEKKAQSAGIAIQGHTGSASTFGGRFTWTYDSTAGQLTITVTETPFLMTCDSVNARIKSMVEAIPA